jgi:hypothetical protein
LVLERVFLLNSDPSVFLLRIFGTMCLYFGVLYSRFVYNII